MEDYKILRELEQIDIDNSFLKYIIERVLDKDYRGYQCSQHNRLTFNYFNDLLSIIYEVAQDKKFFIHVGDDFGEYQLQAKIYYEIVDKVKIKTGKGTINSIKKNTFPDIDRMGFLLRYDKNDDLIGSTQNKKGRGIYSAQLSPKGVKFVNSDMFTKIKLFTDGIDIITKNTASELVEFFYLNDYGIDYITLIEYMYIFSDDRDNISFNDKIRYLIEYRRLNPEQKHKLHLYLKKFCNPDNRKIFKDKTLLRDYSNWKNEAQQIFGLFANSSYFKVDNDKLILNTGNYGIFDKNVIRSQKGKNEYFAKHGVDRTIGFEFHHIIPFSKAQNKSDALLIDDYKNLIYLSKDKHAEFTNRNNKNVKLTYNTENNTALFLDFENNFIIINLKNDCLISYSQLFYIKKYNNELLKKFYTHCIK